MANADNESVIPSDMDDDIMTDDMDGDTAGTVGIMDGYNGMTWADMGVAWGKNERVSYLAGDHASDKVTFQHDVAIAIPVDMEKVRKFFGDKVLLEALDGQGWRVPQQAVMRKAMRDGITDMGKLRQLAIRRLLGIKTRTVSTVTVTVKEYPLPGGGSWTGTDVDDYRRSWIAAAVDNGVDATTAMTIAATLSL